MSDTNAERSVRFGHYALANSWAGLFFVSRLVGQCAGWPIKVSDEVIVQSIITLIYVTGFALWCRWWSWIYKRRSDNGWK